MTESATTAVISSRRWMSFRGTRAPETRRSFLHQWDRLRYLFVKSDYWLRQAGIRSRADRYLAELRELTEALAAENDNALLVWASRALLAEAGGDLVTATRSTERLVDLIGRLLRSWPECPDTTHMDLVRELIALRTLYVRRHKMKEAQAVSRWIVRTSRRHGLTESLAHEDAGLTYQESGRSRRPKASSRARSRPRSFSSTKHTHRHLIRKKNGGRRFPTRRTTVKRGTRRHSRLNLCCTPNAPAA